MKESPLKDRNGGYLCGLRVAHLDGPVSSSHRKEGLENFEADAAKHGGLLGAGSLSGGQAAI